MRSLRLPALSNAGRVAAAMMTMNVATFGFNMIAARLTRPADFGAISAMLGILLIASVVALAIQAVTARRLALHRDEAVAIVAVAARATWTTALSIGALVAASTLVLTPALHLDSYWPVLLCGAAVVPLTVYGGQSGVAQGLGRWNRLGALYASHGLGRLAVGTAALLLAPTVTSAMIGIALAAWIPATVGRGLLRGRRSVARRDLTSFTGEAWLTGSTLLGFLALTNADALLARALLDPHESGLYAAGLIVTKSTLFLPQFVSVVLFPRMAREGSGRAQLIAVQLVAALGATVVAAVAILPDVALVFVGGDRYAEVSAWLWVFAAVGTAQAMLHVLMFGAIARRSHTATVVVWSAVGALAIAAALRPTGVVPLAATVGSICALATAALLVALRRRSVTGVVPGAAHADRDVERD